MFQIGDEVELVGERNEIGERSSVPRDDVQLGQILTVRDVSKHSVSLVGSNGTSWYYLKAFVQHVNRALKQLESESTAL